MKALSMTAPYGQLVRDEIKDIETRVYGTDYRGPILFCCTKSSNCPEAGMALCVADVVDIRMMTKADEKRACCPIYPKARAWILKNVRRVKPFPVRGKLSIFEVDDNLIVYDTETSRMVTATVDAVIEDALAVIFDKELEERDNDYSRRNRQGA